MNNIADGSIAIALHGWLPKDGSVAVASLGAAREKSGKALLFRERETKNYAATFNEAFRPAVAVAARWCGSRGGTEICDTSKWFCVNAIGERIVALPTKDTDVVVMGRDIPSIPPNSKFCSKSFTIDELAIVDTADIDLRGVKVVDLADNTRIITRGGHKIAVNALRGGRLRLDGELAVIVSMKLDGNLEMNGGGFLRLLENPEKACAKSLSVKGEGTVTLMPGVPPKYGHSQKLLRLDEMPKDMTRLRLDPFNGPDHATFKATAGNKFLGATSRKK